MKKIIIFGMIALMMSLSVIAITQIGEGEYILTRNEVKSLSDQQVANYMLSQFNITRNRIDHEGFYQYYNIVRLEPTHNNDTYRVFNSETRTKLSIDDIMFAYNQSGNDWTLTSDTLLRTSQVLEFNHSCEDVCINWINETTCAEWEEQCETRTITTIPKQIENKGLESYESILALRDNLIEIDSMGFE